MKLAMFQMQNIGTTEQNLKQSLNAIEDASKNGADIILFPEVQLTEFFPQYKNKDVSKYRVNLDSDIIKSFCKTCKDNHIMAVPNVYLEENERAYDASIMIDKNGEILGIQKMVHIAQAERFYEQDYYTPSDDGFKVFETDFGKIGIVVCFDRHYPESIRTETLMGADLILVPTVNTKQEPMDMFEMEIRSQAFQNCVAVAMCNRVGKEDEMDFAGESLAVDANGRILTKADDTEQIVYVNIDIDEVRKIRRCKPYTTLRRTEFYL